MTTMSERFADVTANKTVQAAGATASDMAGAAGEQLGEVADQAKQIAHNQLDKLAGTIRTKPLQSAGIAVGIGFVLALLARR
jgi:ElaB/YqjD/DUF883 family membrane-anchored ribosome-binding protein